MILSCEIVDDWALVKTIAQVIRISIGMIISGA